jgi:signal transduction histidine kinase
MLSGVAALALYDRQNRMWSFFLVMYIAFVLLLFDPLHNYFGVGFYQTGHRDESYFFMNIIVLLAFTAQVVGLYILRFSIEKNEMDLLREIEERKKVEVEIRHAKDLAEVANEAKSEFLANVSHEIRTPLNGVIGFSDLLIKTQLDDSQLRYMRVINRSAYSLLDIVNDILDHSKIEAGKIELEIEKTNIDDLCVQVMDVMCYQSQQKNQKLILSIATEVLLFIYTDAIRLRQILINLLGNAIKFTKQGEVELIVKQVGTVSDHVTLQFSVRDTGIGIDPKDQVKIFEAFTQGDISSTKKFGGSGLGLTISNSLLALMDSRLELTSEVNKGSTFSFTLVTKTVL